MPIRDEFTTVFHVLCDVCVKKRSRICYSRGGARAAAVSLGYTQFVATNAKGETMEYWACRTCAKRPNVDAVFLNASVGGPLKVTPSKSP